MMYDGTTIAAARNHSAAIAARKQNCTTGSSFSNTPRNYRPGAASRNALSVWHSLAPE